MDCLLYFHAEQLGDGLMEQPVMFVFVESLEALTVLKLKDLKISGIQEELILIWRMARLPLGQSMSIKHFSSFCDLRLYTVPTQPESAAKLFQLAEMFEHFHRKSRSWIDFKNPGDDLVGDNWLEYVDISVAGMPLRPSFEGQGQNFEVRFVSHCKKTSQKNTSIFQWCF